MSRLTLRPVEFVAAAVVSVTVLIIAIAPALLATPPAAASRGGHTAGIESTLSPESRLA